jgi:hypothetical protein
LHFALKHFFLGKIFILFNSLILHASAYFHHLFFCYFLNFFLNFTTFLCFVFRKCKNLANNNVFLVIVIGTKLVVHGIPWDSREVYFGSLCGKVRHTPPPPPIFFCSVFYALSNCRQEYRNKCEGGNYRKPMLCACYLRVI